MLVGQQGNVGQRFILYLLTLFPQILHDILDSGCVPVQDGI